MSMDLLSNMLSSIKNASMSKKVHIEIPHSRECESVAKILKTKGFLAGVKSFKPKGKNFKLIGIDLAFNENGDAVVSDVKRVSKPGRRIYATHNDLSHVAGGFGVGVISTSRGIMDTTEAKKKKLGGEVICKVF